jgi:hypothetical protein
LRDEFLVVPVQRDVKDGRHREARLLAINQCGVSCNHASLLERVDLSPAGRGGHADLLGQLLVALTAVPLQVF